MRLLKTGRRWGPVATLSALLSATAPTAAVAQVQYKPPPSPAPVLTGAVGAGGTTTLGDRSVSPELAPIFLVPFGNRFLIETEVELEGEFESEPGAGWERKWEKAVEYAQLDWFASRYATVVAGRFLTPFGIYNERLHSLWIRNLPNQPLIAAMSLTSANGAMVRGGVPVGRKLIVSYSVFGSSASDRTGFRAEKATGGRGSVFLPFARLEIGSSFMRTLGDERVNQYGVDLTWQANAWPLDVRAEAVRNADRGSGYWTEAAYRLRRLPFARRIMRASQVVFRAEQFFVPTLDALEGGEAETHGALPDEDTRRFTAGWNYWISPDVRASVSFGRTLNDDGNRNTWSFGLTYRFAAPLARRTQ